MRAARERERERERETETVKNTSLSTRCQNYESNDRSHQGQTDTRKDRLRETETVKIHHNQLVGVIIVSFRERQTDSKLEGETERDRDSSICFNIKLSE